MKSINWRSVACVALVLVAPLALADRYTDTVALFRHAGQTAEFFRTSYGYAVFPTIGKGGFVVGAAHGDGRVYRQGRYIGDTSMTQLSVGFQIQEALPDYAVDHETHDHAVLILMEL